MSWGSITGEERLIPGGGGGLNEIKFESGKPMRVKLLMLEGEQPYSYFEHSIELETTANGKTERLFRTIRCAKTQANPNAYCPICDGQRFRRRIRNAANIWDFEQNKVQKLNAGDGVWKPIATSRKLGLDVLACDWVIMRTGTDRNDTEYSATNVGATQFNGVVDPSQLFDIKSEYAPHTVDEMKAIIESMGMTWEFAINPPALTYPTLEEALKAVMPNGKYKDQTMQKIWD